MTRCGDTPTLRVAVAGQPVATRAGAMHGGDTHGRDAARRYTDVTSRQYTSVTRGRRVAPRGYSRRDAAVTHQRDALR